VVNVDFNLPPSIKKIGLIAGNPLEPIILQHRLLFNLKGIKCECLKNNGIGQSAAKAVRQGSTTRLILK